MPQSGAVAAPSAVSVFISYSHDSHEHVDRVLEISDRLRELGVDANLDQYEHQPPEGWAAWMQRQIETSEYVLMVCTKKYRERVEKRAALGEGLGATWEGQLIVNAIYDAQCLNGKFISIVL